MADQDLIDPPADAQLPTVRPAIAVGTGGTALTEDAQALLVRCVVDNHLHLPGMFELTFRDLDGEVLAEAGLNIGTQVTVSGTGVDGTSGTLITGEVTAIEAVMHGMTAFTTVRGYTLAHRLQRARHSRTFLNMTDTDVARQVATQAGLPCGGVAESRTTHAYLAQVDQTDAEFLADRALEIGYETGFAAGQFYFRPASTVEAPLSVAPNPLVFRENLISFSPRVSAANLTPDVEVRVWDPMQATAYVATGTTEAGGPLSPNVLATRFAEGGGAGGAGGGSRLNNDVRSLAENTVKGAVKGAFAGGMNPEAALTGALRGAETAATGTLGAELLGGTTPMGGLGGSPLGAGALGPAPSPTAHVVTDRAVADATSVHTAGADAAGALATDLGSTFAEAEGDALGEPAVQPGAVIRVDNVQPTFAGKWLISHARHVFDDGEHGYHTVFAAHGREDRSLVGLASRAGSASRAHIDGVVCGVVSNNLDPLGRARVKAVLPWLSPEFETDWAPAVQISASGKAGVLFVPEVGSEVLMAFEHGDPRRPYVVGSVVNNQAAWSLNTGGPTAALTALSSGLGGIGGQIAQFAGNLENLVDTVSKLTPMGQAVGATGLGGPMMSGGMPTAGDMEQLGEVAGLTIAGGPILGTAMAGASLTQAPGTLPGGGGVPGMPSAGGTSASGPGSGLAGLGGVLGGMMAAGQMGAVQQAPGMVGEVIRTGFVTGTGNALVFNDQPAVAASAMGGSALPGAELMHDVDDVAGSGALGGLTGGGSSGGGASGGGMPGGLGGGSKLTAGLGAGNALAAGGPPLASSITLGTAMGNHGLYIDQCSSLIILQAGSTPGLSENPMPTLVITTGEGGNVIINGGETLTLASEGTIEMIAPEITIAAETITVAGELIPLTPG